MEAGTTKDATGNYSVQLRALRGNTVYYYRPYVTIDGNTFYGQTSSHQTKVDNVCQTGEADDEWNVSSRLTIGGGAYSKLELGVCYSKDSEWPTVSDSKEPTIDVDDDGYFTVHLPIIDSGTWRYRAYVLIDGSAHYGVVREKNVKMPIKCPIDGYTLVWNDEFDGTALNTSDWAYDTGSHGWGNNKTIATAQTEFHTYGMEWTSQKMDFYIDGVKFFTYKNDGKGHDSWPFDAAFYPILNLAWGGNWGGAQGIDESALPAVYEIDYVRIFQK